MNHRKHGLYFICRPSGQSLKSTWDDCAFFILTDSGKDIFVKKVGIIMGSDSDLPVVEKAISTLADLRIPTEVHVYSAHRTPVEAREFSVNARANGFGAIIAAAGKAAHLAGAIAANTTLPVIGIPVKSSTLDGIDALLSTVQMPAGIPVATVAIDGAANAALLAAQIIAVDDADLAARLDEMRKSASEKVLRANAEIEKKYSTV
jgi:5-(carboxyamino)imidazole ribonucleotide mutase